MTDPYLDGITKGQAYRDAYRDAEWACLSICRWAAPKFEAGLRPDDIDDTFGSSVLTELFWQVECA